MRLVRVRNFENSASARGFTKGVCHYCRCLTSLSWSVLDVDPPNNENFRVICLGCTFRPELIEQPVVDAEAANIF